MSVGDRFTIRENASDGRMTFFEHLGELRRRLLYCIALLFIVAVVSLSFAPEMFEWLRGPLLYLPHQKLIVLSPIELYITYLKLGVLAAIFISSPFLLLQLWLFVAPGLYPQEKRWLGPFVIIGSLFFVAGGAFAYYIVLPLGFKFVVSQMPETISAQYSVAIYFKLVIQLILAFGIVFELPLIMWILSAAGIVTPKFFSRMRRYWLIASLIIGALLTPPDPFTQILMAVPLIAFYEIGVFGAKIMHRRRNHQRESNTQTTATSNINNGG
ncbi:MAG: twin-arginine translocase subunit TatC [Deltaproteobacteria bacterium]|nr:twin-arginine translocase subunit TatC [Deltaproteobacteria bacterium]